MQRARNVSAVLGPTNTGKTHLAVARMLDHETGMIGLPLRLLAREVYDKVAERVGAQAVALITGEEKIVPIEPRFYVCTVEAMPRDLKVDFLAVDEVQLAFDLDRGHIFTDRILHARGSQETMLLGSDTVRGLLTELLPGLNIDYPAAVLQTYVCRPEENHTPAAPKRCRRVFRRNGLQNRRAHPPATGRGRCCTRCAKPPHT